MAYRNFLRARSPMAVLGVAAAVLLVAAGLAWIGFGLLSRGDVDATAGTPDAGWQTYTNARFGFALDVPAGWEVYEGRDPYVPVVNVYPPIVSQKPPFDQAADVVSVSIFPQGMRNTVILSQSVRSSTKAAAAGDLTEFKLQSGETWALRLEPATPPKTWKPWGFVWARARVTGLSFGCLRAGAEIPYDDCDPNGGDDVVRRGTIDAPSAKVVSQILQSFRFVATSTPAR